MGDSSSEDLGGESIPQERQVRKRKSLPCCFCPDLFKKLSEHIENHHSNEPEVQKLKGKDQKERAAIFQTLRLRGYQRHNEIVRQKATGELIPSYKKKNATDPQKLVPCPDCGKLLIKYWLKQHKCPIDKDTKLKNNIKVRAKELLLMKKKMSSSVTSLLNSMQIDEVRDIISRDALLLKYAEVNLAKVTFEPAIGSEESSSDDNGEDLAFTKSAKNTLKADLRILGRFVLKYRNRTGTNATMATILKTFEMHGMKGAIEDFSHRYRHPFEVKKLQILLRRITDLFGVELLKEGEGSKMFKSVKARLEEVMKIVNTHVVRTKSKYNLTKRDEMPTDKDVEKLKTFIKKNLQQLMIAPIQGYTTYRELCSYTIAHITLYNLRRSGEVAKMTTNQFHNREKSRKSQARKSAFNEEEREDIDIVKLKGKSSGHQEVLAYLLPDMVSYIQKILNVRQQVPEIRNSKFVFAVKGEGDVYASGHKAIRKIAQAAGVQDITAGKLRKQIATDAVFAQDPTERELVACQEGHSMAIQRETYELTLKKHGARFDRMPKLLRKIDKAHGQTTASHIDVRRSSSSSDCSTSQSSVRHSSTSLSCSNSASSSKSCSPREKDTQNQMQTPWTIDGEKIINSIFKDEINRRQGPIKAEKIRKCEMILQERGITKSYQSIKSTVYNIIKGQRAPYTNRK